MVEVVKGMSRREVEDGANLPDMTACRSATTCHLATST